MKDQLLDLVKHIVPLGASAFTNIRIDGTSSITELSATETEKQVVVQGKFHNVIPTFEGTFGIPNINVLGSMLNLPVYTNDNATLSVIRNDTQPTTIHMYNASENFKNDFRLIGSKIIDNLEPKLRLNVSNWPVVFEPSQSSITKLKYQSDVNSGEKNVTFRLENGTLTAYMGDETSLSGSFQFHTNIGFSGTKSIIVPISYVRGILNLTGDKVIKIGDLGMMICIDSGIATYNYIMPTLAK